MRLHLVTRLLARFAILVVCTLNMPLMARTFDSFKKISSLKVREDICIIYSTFLYYLTFKLARQIGVSDELPKPWFRILSQIWRLEPNGYKSNDSPAGLS
jgi:hypothetical protein